MPIPAGLLPPPLPDELQEVFYGFKVLHNRRPVKPKGTPSWILLTEMSAMLDLLDIEDEEDRRDYWEHWVALDTWFMEQHYNANPSSSN